jgi:hypothetical protein
VPAEVREVEVFQPRRIEPAEYELFKLRPRHARPERDEDEPMADLAEAATTEFAVPQAA